MPHVICEPCRGCKYTECIEFCPVPGGCFCEGERQLYIDPAKCIDCEACVPRCPVEAIYLHDEVPEKWRHYIALNAEMVQTCPRITEKRPRDDGGGP